MDAVLEALASGGSSEDLQKCSELRTILAAHNARRLREELVAWRRDEEKRQSEAQLEEAVAAVELGKAELERSEELRRTKMISQGEFDVLTMNFRCAE